MIKRITAAGVVLAVSTFGAPVGTSNPVAAAQPMAPTFISGNFVGDAADEVFVYRAGEPHDSYLVVFDNGGVPGGELSWDTHPFTVDHQDLVPVAGDFDGDDRDEIFWYGPGDAPDSIWHFQGTGSVVRLPTGVSGTTYQPIAGDFTGDGADDIHWYAPGPTPDPLWEFEVGNAYWTHVRNVSGHYRPVVASIGKDDTDDTIWYGPGGTPDSVWDWTQGTLDHTTQALSVAGTTYQPFRYDYYGDGRRGDDVYWYAQGSTGDPVWEYLFGQQFRLDDIASPHDDEFDTAVAGDYFGDGRMDILFVTNADLSDFTLFDANIEDDFVYEVPGTTGSATVTPEVSPRIPSPH